MTTDDVVDLVSNNSCCARVFVSLVEGNSDLAPQSQANATVKAVEGVPLEGIQYIRRLNWGLDSREEKIKEPLRRIVHSQRLC